MVNQLCLYNGKIAPDMRNNINGVLKGRGTGPGLPFANRSNVNPANSNWMGSLRTG